MRGGEFPSAVIRHTLWTLQMEIRWKKWCVTSVMARSDVRALAVNQLVMNTDKKLTTIMSVETQLFGLNVRLRPMSDRVVC